MQTQKLSECRKVNRWLEWNMDLYKILTSGFLISRSKCLGGGGTWLADERGSAAQFSESYPLLITETSHHTNFYDEFLAENYPFLSMLPVSGKPTYVSGKSDEKGPLRIGHCKICCNFTKFLLRKFWRNGLISHNCQRGNGDFRFFWISQRISFTSLKFPSKNYLEMFVFFAVYCPKTHPYRRYIAIPSWVIGFFSSKTWTWLKTQLLFMF